MSIRLWVFRRPIMRTHLVAAHFAAAEDGRVTNARCPDRDRLFWRWFYLSALISGGYQYRCGSL